MWLHLQKITHMNTWLPKSTLKRPCSNEPKSSPGRELLVWDWVEMLCQLLALVGGDQWNSIEDARNTWSFRFGWVKASEILQILVFQIHLGGIFVDLQISCIEETSETFFDIDMGVLWSQHIMPIDLWVTAHPKACQHLQLFLCRKHLKTIINMYEMTTTTGNDY